MVTIPGHHVADGCVAGVVDGVERCVGQMRLRNLVGSVGFHEIAATQTIDRIQVMRRAIQRNI
jgi:hypothetical protein